MSIDYGHGTTNCDHETGIRYGVISLNSVAHWVHDEMEMDYGDATCPECGSDKLLESSDSKASNYADKDYFCERCYRVFLEDNEEIEESNLEASIEEDAAKFASHFSDVCFSDEPLGWSIKDSEYSITNCLDSDAFILKSPYFTYAFFCSPCVPGAGDIDSGATVADYEAGEACKAYCLGKDFFDECSPIPYTVYSVETGEKVA